jgi:hypothetical protein
MSTIWDVIPYEHLSHGSWPLGFLTPHLIPTNTYLCSLVIFVRVKTTKVTDSCSFKSWFMLGLTMRTAMLGLEPLPLADGLLETTQPQRLTKRQLLTFISPDGCQGQLGRQ